MAMGDGQAMVQMPPMGEYQPDLLGVDSLPRRDDLVELVKKGYRHHTGARLLNRDHALCEEIVRELLTGTSARQIARRLNVSRQSINGIRDEMEKRGLVEPLKKRISGLLGTIIEAGLENLQDALLAGQISAAQLPVAMGILIDKKALVDGDPTVRIAQERPSDLTVESVRAHFDKLKKGSIDVTAIESESSATTAKPE